MGLNRRFFVGPVRLLGGLPCALLWLAACSPAPERDAFGLAGETPAAWTALSGAAARDAVEPWLADYRDETLTALVREALAGNFDLKTAAARVQAAQAQARIDGAGRLPQLNFAPRFQEASVNPLRGGSPSAGDQRDGGTQLALPFNLSWELDVWGRIGAARQAAAWEAEAAAADLAGARLSLAARTAQAYFELTEARLQSQVAEQSKNDHRTVVELVRGRYVRGLTRPLDLRLALTDLTNAEAQLAQARNRVQGVGGVVGTLSGGGLGRRAGPARAAAGGVRRPAVGIAGTASRFGRRVRAAAIAGLPFGKRPQGAAAARHPHRRRRHQRFGLG
ncbi:TolC family protein [Methylogaea oryzae]|uniref:Uncharacterized protein n=1 Tax=Methylogaea oryzae TaxID=1295382 RepID=A0A8D4VP65_9GAMM|nr:hypothetical protein MoryE10_17430 [Methylogaea oryzae]